eukprot:443773_1
MESFTSNTSSSQQIEIEYQQAANQKSTGNQPNQLTPNQPVRYAPQNQPIHYTLPQNKPIQYEQSPQNQPIHYTLPQNKPIQYVQSSNQTNRITKFLEHQPSNSLNPYLQAPNRINLVNPQEKPILLKVRK